VAAEQHADQQDDHREYPDGPRIAIAACMHVGFQGSRGAP
jgi:hypothetical protein